MAEKTFYSFPCECGAEMGGWSEEDAENRRNEHLAQYPKDSIVSEMQTTQFSEE